MTDKNDNNARNEDGTFKEGNTWGFQKGKSGNPNGRPKKDAILAELDTDLGSAPRELLYKILDQAVNGTKHFGKTARVSAAIKKISLHDIVKISTYLDEQSNGKAKQSTELSGVSIVLPDYAKDL